VGWYSQIGHLFGDVRPYVRYQYVNGAASDPLLGTLGRQSGPAFGARYELNRFSAVKAQVERTHRTRTASSTDGSIQLAFTF
jgi:hypothetical protein